MTTRVALICSAHGLGHTTRQLAVAEALLAHGARPTLFSKAPRDLVFKFSNIARPVMMRAVNLL